MAFVSSKGWAFPVTTDVYGGIKLSSDEQNIEESIKIIIETSLGEMLTNQNFGCRLHTLMFSSVNAANIRLAEDYISGALRRWEPRISVRSVRGKKNPDVSTAIDFEIDYDIPYLKTRDKASYQFKPQGEDNV